MDRPRDRPIFIISPPRSGSTLLFQTLAHSPSLATIGGESHALIEGVPALHPRNRGWTSNRLTAGDATPDVVSELTHRFGEALRDREGGAPRPGQRLLEKTPKNALRVPFLAAAWPDATYLYLHRAARPTLSSMIEAWQSGHFRTYPRLPDWPGLPWSLLLVPGWRELAGKPLSEIVARQWAATVDILVADLAALPPGRVLALSYDEFVATPQSLAERLSAALALDWDRQLAERLPLSRTTVTPPAPDKWRRHGEAIEAVWPLAAEADARAAAFAARYALP